MNHVNQVSHAKSMKLFVRVTPTAHGPLGCDVPRGGFTYVRGSRGSNIVSHGTSLPEIAPDRATFQPTTWPISGSDWPLTRDDDQGRGIHSVGGGTDPRSGKKRSCSCIGARGGVVVYGVARLVKKVPRHPHTVTGGICTMCHPYPCNHSPPLALFLLVTHNTVQYLMCVEEQAGVASATPANPCPAISEGPKASRTTGLLAASSDQGSTTTKTGPESQPSGRRTS
jgi:hypothetical protein